MASVYEQPVAVAFEALHGPVENYSEDPTPDVVAAASDLLRVLTDKKVIEGTVEEYVKLVNSLEAWHAYRRQRLRAEESKMLGSKPCEACHAGIFFAKARNGKWIPFEADRLGAAEVPSKRRYVVRIDPTGTARFAVDPLATGAVWVNHHMTCGVTEAHNFEGSEALERRWNLHHQRLNVAAESLAKNLLRLRRELRG